MMDDQPVTELLRKWSQGDEEAAAQVIPSLYDELRRLAAAQLRREQEGHTLQPTAIVHEAFLRLHGQAGLEWQNRRHFYGFAAHLIRRILVDHARQRQWAKRGGGLLRVELGEAAAAAARTPDLLALDDALAGLEKLDPRKAAVVELRFFGGLSVEESAAYLGVSVETVGREWRRARAWLRHTLEPRPERTSRTEGSRGN
jgi:RNA polymerase sigma factor (TIGR02999 family)